MKSLFTKAIVACFALLMPFANADAQTMADDFGTDMAAWASVWKNAFSAEGRKQWRPEFTGRVNLGIYSGGYSFTGGVRIDRKRTLGLMVGQGNIYIDAAPGHIKSIQTCAYKRYYMYPGKRGILAFYSDLYLGADWVYEVTGDKYSYWMDENGTMHSDEQIHADKGDVYFYAAWEPGIRLRIVRNLHLFLGSSVSTHTIGIHAGIGF